MRRAGVVGVLVMLLLVMAAGSVMGKGERIKEADSTDVTFEIKGTDSDTSRVYQTSGTMTVSHVMYDQIHADSVDIDLDLQMQGADGKWVSAKSTTVTDDSTGAFWLITNTAVASGEVYRMIVTGGSDNCKDGEVLVKLMMHDGN